MPDDLGRLLRRPRALVELEPSAGVIRALLARVEGHPSHLFLRLAIDPDAPDATVVADWQRATTALHDLASYELGQARNVDAIKRLATEPRVVAAAQGTAAHRKDVHLKMLALLVAEGSPSSLDALVPHLDAAIVGRDVRLERLERLRPYAADTPIVRQIFDAIDQTLDDRRARSPALELAAALGLEPLAELWFDVQLATLRRVTLCRINVDSRASRWFGVWAVQNHRRTTFSCDGLVADEIGVGACTARELPAWLATVAGRLRIDWRLTKLLTGLRGRDRDRIAAWLNLH